jgi:hypothetical protein
MPTSTIQITELPDATCDARHGVAYQVTAYDIHGRVLRRRTYRRGRVSNRQAWAVEQAHQWAEQFYLYFDETLPIPTSPSSQSQVPQAEGI